MKARHLIAAGAVITLVGILGFASVLVGINPVSAVVDGDDRDPPELQSFVAGGAHCTDDFAANSSTVVRSGGANTQVTYERNVSLPDPSYAIGDPRFDRHNESTYVLSIPIDETEKAPRDCTGVARYNASMRIPAGDDPWRIIVDHDGETVTTLFGDSDSSAFGGSASAGGSASG